MDQSRANATWFVIHQPPMLDGIQGVGTQEFGLNPKCDVLLHSQTARASDTVDHLQQLTPEALSISSHSFCRSSRLVCTICEIRSTHRLPPSAQAGTQAWHDLSELIQVLIQCEDDIRLIDWSPLADAITRVIRASSRPPSGASIFLEGASKVTVCCAGSTRRNYETFAINGQVPRRSESGDNLVDCGNGVLVIEGSEKLGGSHPPATKRYRLTRAKADS